MGLDSADKYAINKLTSIYNVGILFFLLDTGLIVYHAGLFFVFYRKTNILNEQTDDISFMIFLVFHFIAVLPAIAYMCQITRANRTALEENKSRLQYVYFSYFVSIFTWLYANFVSTVAVFTYAIHLQLKIFNSLLFVFSFLVSVWAFSGFYTVNGIVGAHLPSPVANNGPDANANVEL